MQNPLALLHSILLQLANIVALRHYFSNKRHLDKERVATSLKLLRVKVATNKRQIVEVFGIMAHLNQVVFTRRVLSIFRV